MTATPSGRWTLATATASTTLAVLPPTLVGGLGFLLRPALHFDEAHLGAAVATFFAATALSSVLGGRAAQRLGAAGAMSVAAGGTCICLVGIATVATTWTHLAVFLVAGGVANGLAQPGSNMSLAAGVARRRQGLAFGVKQSAVPAAGLIVAAAVPVAGLEIGWRTTVVAIAAVATCVTVGLAALPRSQGPAARRPAAPGSTAGDLSTRALVLLAAGCCLATSAALSLSTFVVEYAVNLGFRPAAAALLLSCGAGASIAVRLTTGWSSDRSGRRPLATVGAVLAAGALGYAVLSIGGDSPSMLVLAVIVASGLGWGWPALFALTVVRLNPRAPGAASGVTQAGGALGGVVGPLLFGTLVVHASYRTAWLCAAVAAGAAAAIMTGSSRWLEQPGSGLRRSPGAEVS